MTTQQSNNNSGVPAIVLFAALPEHVKGVTALLAPLQPHAIHAVYSEEEGMEKIKSLPQVDIVIVAGTYGDEARQAIRAALNDRFPQAALIQPGRDFERSDDNIFAAVKQALAALPNA